MTFKSLQDKVAFWHARAAAVPSSVQPVADSSDVGMDAEVHFRVGMAHRNAGRTQKALASFEHVIQIRADYAEAHCQCGELLADCGRSVDAGDRFALALAFDATLAAAWLGYGKLLLTAGRVHEAIDHLRRAVVLAPASYESRVELALALNDSGQTAEAAAAYEKAIAVDPKRVAAYVNLGLIFLAQLGNAAKAEALFRCAIEIAPHDVAPQVNLGLALHEQGRSQAALLHFNRLLEEHPQCNEYRWHRAVVRLGVGDYERGWEDHEARKLRAGHAHRPGSLVEWDGSVQAARKLLVYGEQGLGDQIMFASCLPDVLQVAESCVLECDARLVTLFQRSFPRARVGRLTLPSDDGVTSSTTVPGVTSQCALGSLPKYFRLSPAAFDSRAPYLRADPERVTRWREHFRASGRLNVGIAWQGGTRKTRRELRSTALWQWEPLLATGCARFFALHPASREELHELHSRTGLTISSLRGVYDDLEELAASIAALDLVIAVQGTPAHVAGALGRPVWTLLNYSPGWRYPRAGERMPWYASARLFRQRSVGDWTAVFADAAFALHDIAAQSGHLHRE